MKKWLSTIFLLALLIPCYCSAANLLYSEDFDDQDVDQPSVGTIETVKDNWNEAVEGVDFDLDTVGYGGTGYCFNAAYEVPSYLVWWYSTTWPTNEMYVSFYMKFSSYGGGLNKFFYPHWDGTASKVVASVNSANSINWHVLDKTQTQIDQQYITCTGLANGNWHHWEFYVNFSTGTARLWYDSALKYDETFGADTWTNSMYYITCGSINNTATGYQRQLDEWEVWDGMPTGGSAPAYSSSTATDDGSLITINWDSAAYEDTGNSGCADTDFTIDSAAQGNGITLTNFSKDSSSWTFYSPKAIPTGDTVTVSLETDDCVCDSTYTYFVDHTDLTDESVTVSDGHDGETWYVCPSGGSYQAENGSSYANAFDGSSDVDWTATVGVDDGDTLYVCDTHTDETLTIGGNGSNGSVIMIDGTYSGHAGSITASSSLTRGIDINDKDYITIDLDINGTSSQYITTGIDSRGGSKNITIQNSTIQYCAGSAITFEGVSDSDWAEDNKVDNCIISNIGTYGSPSGNDIGLGDYSRSITIEDSTLSGDGSTYGADGITFNTPYGSGFIIQRNTIYGHAENAIDFKQMYESAGAEGDTTVAENELYQNANVEIIIQTNSSGINIKHNKIHDSNAGILIQRSVGYTEGGQIDIVYNLFYDLDVYGISEGGNSGTISMTNKVLNNTFYDCMNNDTGTSAALVIKSEGWTVRNNIFYMNSMARYLDSKVAQQIRIEDEDDDDVFGHTIDYNTLFHPNESTGQVIYHYDGSNYTLVQWRANTDYGDNSEENDPQLKDASNGDLTLIANSLARNAGTPTAYVNGLDPDSSWPDSVTTLNQGDYGSGWEIGAYVFESVGNYKGADLGTVSKINGIDISTIKSINGIDIQ